MAIETSTATGTGKPIVRTVDEFVRDYKVSRTTTYAEIKAGRLKVRKVGRRTLITDRDSEAWLESSSVAA